MANNLYAGAMHWLDVTYEEDSQVVKSRPVLILYVENNKIYYFQITTQRGKMHQRKYRPILKDWKQSGLKECSYIKLKNPPQIAHDSDFSSYSFIGDISQTDADNMSTYMDNLNY